MADTTFELPHVTVRQVPLRGRDRVDLGEIKTHLINENKSLNHPGIDAWIDTLADIIAAYDQQHPGREWVA